MKTKSLKLLALIAGFATVGALSVQAGEKELLDTMVAKGYITSAEAKEISKGSTTFAVKGKKVEKITFSGTVHYQYDSLQSEDTNFTAAGTSTKSESGATNQFYFRNLILGVDAKLMEKWGAYIAINYGGNNAAIDQDAAYIYWDYSDYAKFRFGYNKVPFAFQETLSSSSTKTIERNIMTRFFTEGNGLAFSGRNTGIHSSGKTWFENLTYSAAVVENDVSNTYTDAVAATAANTNDNGLGYFGRLQYNIEGNWGKLLIGGDLGYKQDGTTSRGILAGTATRGDILGYGMHAVWQYNNFQLYTEFLGAEVESSKVVGTTVQDANPYGFVIEPSYKITPEWEVVAAYSVVNSNGMYRVDEDNLVRRAPASSFSGGRYDDGRSWYVGVNYYVLGNDVKVMGGYESARFSNTATTPATTFNNGDKTDIDGFRLRLQLLF